MGRSRVGAARVAAALLVGLALGPRPSWGRVQQNAKAEAKQVDEAIARGINHLLQAESPSSEGKGWSIAVPHSDELFLLTFLHAGGLENHARFQALLKKTLEAPLEYTYNVALQAMVLEELDRVRHQKRIWECAQFLVDTQFASGAWGYGEPVTIPAPPVPEPPKEVRTPSKSAPPKKDTVSAKRRKPEVRQRLRVKKTRDGSVLRPNNSTSQYAALGLRACHDAGIIIPEETIKRAIQWWEAHHHSGKAAEKGGAVATGPGGDAVGWCYYFNAQCEGGPSGSMTAGALGSLAIYDSIRGADWKKNPLVRGGMNWLGSHFTVDESCEMKHMYAVYGFSEKKFAYYYFLYGLERAGILCDTEWFGRHAWYREGAARILKAQRRDGSWNGSVWDGKDVEFPAWDTCFAILFLKRATQPLRDVASVDPFHPREKP